MKFKPKTAAKIAAVALITASLLPGTGLPTRADTPTQILAEQRVQDQLNILINNEQRKNQMERNRIGQQEQGEQQACDNAQRLADLRIDRSFFVDRDIAHQNNSAYFDRTRQEDHIIRDQEGEQVDTARQNAIQALEDLQRTTQLEVVRGNPYSKSASIISQAYKIVRDADQLVASIMTDADGSVHVLLGPIDPQL